MAMQPFIYPKPDNELFETYCLKVFRAYLKLPHLQKFALRGQVQFGIDLLSVESCHVVGIQCRNKITGKKLTIREADEIIEDAKNFAPLLNELVIATTADRDPDLQRHIASVNLNHQAAGLFKVVTYAWQDIEEVLKQDSDLVGELYSLPGQSASTASVVTHASINYQPLPGVAHAELDEAAQAAELVQPSQTGPTVIAGPLHLLANALSIIKKNARAKSILLVLLAILLLTLSLRLWPLLTSPREGIETPLPSPVKPQPALSQDKPAKPARPEDLIAVYGSGPMRLFDLSSRSFIASPEHFRGLLRGSPRTAILFDETFFKEDLYTKDRSRLELPEGAYIKESMFSPDKSKLAFVRQGEIWTASVDWRAFKISKPQQVTQTGGAIDSSYDTPFMWSGKVDQIYVKAVGNENLWYRVNISTRTIDEAGEWIFDKELPDYGYTIKYTNYRSFPTPPLRIYNRAEDSWVRLPSDNFPCLAEYVCSFEKVHLFSYCSNHFLLLDKIDASIHKTLKFGDYYDANSQSCHRDNVIRFNQTPIFFDIQDGKRLGLPIGAKILALSLDRNYIVYSNDTSSLGLGERGTWLLAKGEPSPVCLSKAPEASAMFLEDRKLLLFIADGKLQQVELDKTPRLSKPIEIADCENCSYVENVTFFP